MEKLTVNRGAEEKLGDNRDERLSRIIPTSTICPLCNGIRFVHPTDGSARVVRYRVVECPACQGQKLKERYIRLSLLPPDDPARFANFERRPGTGKAFAAAKLMAEGKAKHHFLVLVGEPGTGKTHLARAIAWEWIDRLAGLVLYYKASRLFNDLRRGYEQKPERPGEPSGYDRLMSRVLNSSLVILDDIGVEKTSEWSLDTLDTIVDHRYERRLSTVFTTNLSLDLLASARVRDRISEGVVAILQTTSYRLIKAKENR